MTSTRNAIVIVIIFIFLIFLGYLIFSGKMGKINDTLAKKTAEDYYLQYLNNGTRKSGIDSVLCSDKQNPQNITFKVQQIKNNTATVLVSETYNQEKFTHSVTVKIDGGKAKISDVNCNLQKGG